MYIWLTWSSSHNGNYHSGLSLNGSPSKFISLEVSFAVLPRSTVFKIWCCYMQWISTFCKASREHALGFFNIVIYSNWWENSQDQVMETEALVLVDDYANDVFNKSSRKVVMIMIGQAFINHWKTQRWTALSGHETWRWSNGKKVANEMQIFKEIETWSTTTLCADLFLYKNTPKECHPFISIHHWPVKWYGFKVNVRLNDSYVLVG